MKARPVGATSFAVALCALLALPAHGHAQGEIFERGNQLYQEGDYAGAIEAYEAVLAAGYESADLHYNLGNAHFKAGSLGRAILEWEKARLRAPADPDVLANLELARSLTADEVEPLPRFWLLSLVSWWIGLLPRGALLLIVGGAWLAAAGGGALRILARGSALRRVGTWATLSGAAVLLVFGTTLVIRELGLGRPTLAVILSPETPVRSAPADDDDLTLFQVHEGTRVRVDQRTGDWAEIVLEDGKVGWVPTGVMGLVE